MEKKNTILLTVIAIATLLVAVVGATFAYFTASVTPQNETNNTVNVTTHMLTNVSADYGLTVSAEEEGKAVVYPGAAWARSLKINPTCEEGKKCENMDATITITGTDPDSVFGKDIEWELYRMNAATDEITCQIPTNPTINNQQYSAPTECTGLTDGTKVANGTLENPGANGVLGTYNLTGDNALVAGTDVTYFLVVKYINREDIPAVPGEEENEGTPAVSGNQNAQQGKNFSVSFKLSI